MCYEWVFTQIAPIYHVTPIFPSSVFMPFNLLMLAVLASNDFWFCGWHFFKCSDDTSLVISVTKSVIAIRQVFNGFYCFCSAY